MSLNKSSVAAIQDYHIAHVEGFYEKSFVQPMLGNFMGITAKDKILLRSAQVDGGLQGYQPGHHMKGGVSFNGRELNMKMVKDDKRFETRSFDVEDYDSYMNRTGNDPRQFPYQAYVLSLIYKALYETFVLEVLWTGKHLPIIPGAPNNPSDTADGLREHMLASTLAGTLPRYITGLLTSANAVDVITDYIEANLDTTSKEGREHGLYLSLQALRLYKQAYRDQYGADTHAFDANGLLTAHDYPNVKLLPQDGLKGSQMVIARPDNFFVGFDGAPFTEMRYESRYMYVEIDWKYATQYRADEELYPNEWI